MCFREKQSKVQIKWADINRVCFYNFLYLFETFQDDAAGNTVCLLNKSFILSGPCQHYRQSLICSKIPLSVPLVLLSLSKTHTSHAHTHDSKQYIIMNPPHWGCRTSTHKHTRTNYSAFHIQWTTSWLTAVCTKVKGWYFDSIIFLMSRLELLNAVADVSAWLTLWNIHWMLWIWRLWFTLKCHLFPSFIPALHCVFVFALSLLSSLITLLAFVHWFFEILSSLIKSI